MAQAISRVIDGGSVVSQLTIERSEIAFAMVRDGAAEEANFDPPPPVVTLTTQTTIRLKPGQALVVSGGQPSSKQSGQSWIVVTASVSDSGSPSPEVKAEPSEVKAAK
jgi:hypothetical protein